MAKANGNAQFINHGTGYADIQLTRPLEVNGAQLSTIRMREPTVDDQLAMDEVKGGDAAKELTLMANLCEIAQADLRRLPLRDYKRIQLAFVGFID